MESKIGSLLAGPLVVVNLGLNQFALSLEAQGAQVVQVSWTPPASGDKEMMALLDDLL